MDPAQLAALRLLRDTTDDPAQRAALDAAIAALEGSTGALVSLAGSQTGDVTVGDVAGRDQIGQQANQSASGDATIGAMVGGDVGRDLTLFTGEAAPTALLAERDAVLRVLGAAS